MDWMQVLTILVATIGSTYGFFMIIREDTKEFKAEIKDDMKIFKDDMVRMDEKWERLFDRLLIQDKK